MNLLFDQAEFSALSLHFISNRAEGLELDLIDKPARVSRSADENLVCQNFLSFFDVEMPFQFSPSAESEVFSVQNILDRIESRDLAMHEGSRILAEKLFEVSKHHTVKACEFFLARIDNIILEDELITAFGLFKTEERQKVLLASAEDGAGQLQVIEGIDMSRLSKGALFFRSGADENFISLIVDRVSLDARYWTEDFLGLERMKDGGFHTDQYLNMCKDFAETAFPASEDKNSQITFLNKSLQYFKNNETFAEDEFANQVVAKPELVQQFRSFSNDYGEEKGYEDFGKFEISEPALKKIQRRIKNLIRLDTEIEIRVKSENPETSSRFVERGFDESRGMYFYKVFFNAEQ